MGSIRVRCAKSHRFLWFHLDVEFAEDHLHPDFRTDGKDRKLNELLRRDQPWDQLTLEGWRITKRVLAIKRFFCFKQVRSLDARPDYFCVEVDKERQWKRVLPEVVTIIREETNDPTATVIPYIRELSTPVDQWHEPLLKRMFG